MGNGSDVVGANVNVNGAEYGTNQTGWISLDVSYNAVGRIDWKVIGVSYNGLTDYANSVNDPFIIWDRVNVTDSIVLDRLVQAGSPQAIWLTAEYEYDVVIFDGSKGTVFLNGEPMTWSDQNRRWEQTVTSTILGPQVYEATSVDDEVYGLTAVQNQARKMEVIWDKLEISKMEFETSALGVTKVKVHVAYDYADAPVVDADVSVNGKQCNEIEHGVYSCEISDDWSPVQSFLVEVDIPDFEQATKTVLNIHVSNTLLYVVIGLAIVLTATFFVLRKKRSKQKRETASSGTPSCTRLLSVNFGKNEMG
jgi:LPXTG-motif cell wall-anchored protein